MTHPAGFSSLVTVVRGGSDFWSAEIARLLKREMERVKEWPSDWEAGEDSEGAYVTSPSVEDDHRVEVYLPEHEDMEKQAEHLARILNAYGPLVEMVGKVLTDGRLFANAASEFKQGLADAASLEGWAKVYGDTCDRARALLKSLGEEV